VYGIDISKDFEEIARRNAKIANVIADFKHGNVGKIPYADEYFDFIICTTAFKNFNTPIDALAPSYRV